MLDRNLNLLVLFFFSNFQSWAQLSSPLPISQNIHDVNSFQFIHYDQDGMLDIIADNGTRTATGESSASHFVLYHHEGSGVFSEIELLDLSNPVMASWGDANGDGIVDMIYYDPSIVGEGQSIYVRWGDPSYQFSEPQLVFQTAMPDDLMSFFPMVNGVSTGDLNSDGANEIVICLNYDLTDPTMSYDHVGFFYSFHGDGSGFDSPVLLTSLELFPGSFFSLSRFYFEDYTGDSIDDMFVFVYADFGSDLYIYSGLGDGSLDVNPTPYIGGWDSYDYSNMDSDPDQELVFSFSDYLVRYGVGVVDAYEQFAEDIPSPDLCIMDTDGDGLKDIVYGLGSNVIMGSPGDIHIFQNNGDASSDWQYLLYGDLSGSEILQLGSDVFEAGGLEVLIAASNGDLFYIAPVQQENVVANFTSDVTEVCGSGTVQFSDTSLGNPTDWNWSFPGGTPSSSTDQNPSVYYDTPGSYSAHLQVSQGDLMDEISFSDLITVNSTSLYYADTDGDGFGDSNNSLVLCNSTTGYVLIGGDCDDTNAAIHPNSSEVCNGQDDDCDDQIDEGVLTVYYLDADNDGYGNGSNSLLACSAPVGYVLNNTDCNDSNAGVRPNATELCNGINDDCDALTDEGCGQALVNDNPSGAINLPVNPITVTTLGVGNLTNATPSVESTSNTITGQDVWYKFTAPAPGIRIRVQSSSINLVVELQTMNGDVIDVENINNGLGNEYLNYGNLIEGQQYRIAVRNYNSAQGTGSFTISLSYLNDSFIVLSNPNFEYCQSVIALPVSALAYRFTFTSITTGLSYQYTQNLLTNLRLTKVPGLIAGDTYQVKVNPIFNLTNGIGVMEQLIVHEVYTFQINIQPWTQVFLAANYTCPAEVNVQGNVALNGGACRATDYQWEFTPMDGGSVITQMRGSFLINFPLSLVSLNPGATYQVRVRPKFENGMFGDWGPQRCLQISLNAMSMNVESDETKAVYSEMITDVNDAYHFNNRCSIYPNPSHGEKLVISLQETWSGNLNITVHDMHGKLMLDQQAMNQSENFILVQGMNELAAGVYVISIRGEEWFHTERLVIDKP